MDPLSQTNVSTAPSRPLLSRFVAEKHIPMALSLLKALLVRVPGIVKSSSDHLLAWTPHTQEWDFRTFLTVTVYQEFLCGPTNGVGHDGKPLHVEKLQRLTCTPRLPNDETWAIPCDIPLSNEDEVLELLKLVDRAVRELAVTPGHSDVDQASVGEETLTSEWSGPRNVEARGPRRAGEAWDAQSSFEALISDLRASKPVEGKDGVMLWLHGGEFEMFARTRHVLYSDQRACSVWTQAPISKCQSSSDNSFPTRY